jgi:glycosyltransferase involved in cell wall biosynthesis
MLSVIICTRNRAEKLAQSLYRFAQAQTPSGDWEVIVVDNGSQDHTRDVVTGVVRRQALPLKYTFESKRGLSYARNRGLAQATGSLVAFTDDDCLISETWPDTIVREFTADHELMVVGGRVDPADCQDAPIGIRPFPDRLQICSFGQIMERLIGCNMAFRGGVFRTTGLFDTRLGAGTRVGSAEDVDIFYRALKAGMKTCYSPTMRICHAHGRVDEATVSTLKDSYVRGRGALYCKHLLRGDRVMLKSAVYEIRSWLRGIGVRRSATTGEYASGRALRNLAYGALSRLYLKE